MNASTILSAIKSAIQVATSLYAVGKDIGPILSSVHDILTKGDSVTQADLDALRAQSDAWSAEIQSPLPPEEP